MRAQRCSSGRCFHGGIAPRPLLIFQKSSPSVSLASFFDVQSAGFGGGSAAAAGPSPLPLGPWHVAQFCSASFLASARSFASPFLARSEEHTSELQSRLHLVCRLLLEKKKKNNNHTQLSNNNCSSYQHTHN